MAATTPAKTLSKSDFIRAQPATLSVAEVIAKGKAEGIKFGSSLVYMVRRPAKKKKPAKTAAVAPATKPASSTASKSNLPSKSEFIRSQPGSLSAAEVVAKGKEEGIIFSESLVYKSRGRSKAKKSAAKLVAAPVTNSRSKTPAPKSAAVKTPARTKSKADFARARAQLSPKEIVEDSKAEGVKFDANYVYRVRAMDKAARKKKRAAAKKRTSTPVAVNGAVPSVTSPATLSSAEDLLRAVAAEIGLGRAVEILAGGRARVRELMGG
jgi:hypothetical protein